MYNYIMCIIIYLPIHQIKVKILKNKLMECLLNNK